jgi:hypothetical protein
MATEDDAARTTGNVIAKLAAPFPLKQLVWQVVKVAPDNPARGLIVPTPSHQAILERLDAVMTPFGWSDDYAAHAGVSHSVMHCRLTLIDDEGGAVSKTDVGTSEEPNVCAAIKAASADAFRRAAAKWGIGAYLQKLPPVWWDIDPQTKRSANPPPADLPPWAMPAPGGSPERLRPEQADKIDKLSVQAGFTGPDAGKVADVLSRRFGKTELEDLTPQEADWTIAWLCTVIAGKESQQAPGGNPPAAAPAAG